MSKVYWFRHDGELYITKARSLKRAKCIIALGLGVPRKLLRLADEMMTA